MTTVLRTATAIPRCVIYARCSAEKQAEKDLSIPAQLDAARIAAKQRGWEVVGEFVDAAESASSDDRPQFQEMIAQARNKPTPFSYILVWKFSRFSRNREHSILYKKRLEKLGIRVVSLNEPVDDSPAGKMLEGMLEVMDEFYSQNLAQDTVRGLRKNAALGFRNGGPAPIGYRKLRTGDEVSPKIKLEHDPTWAPVIQRMFKLALEGEGACNIAARLHGEGLKSPRGKPWTKNTILNILRNPVYMGKLVWGVRRSGLQAHKPSDPVEVVDAWPGLVSGEDFEAVQDRILDRSRAVISSNILRSDYVLSGLLVCGHCGQPFIGHPAKGGQHHYYGCQRKMKTGAKSCAAKLLPQLDVERAIVDELCQFVLTPEYLQALMVEVNEELRAASGAQQEELVGVQRQQGEVRRKLDRLYDALENGTMELELLAPRLREQKARLGELEVQEVRLKEAIGGQLQFLADEATVRRYVEKLHALLERGSVAQRRSFLRSWVRQIEAKGYELVIHYSLPPLPVGGKNDNGKEPREEVLSRSSNSSRCWT